MGKLSKLLHIANLVYCFRRFNCTEETSLMPLEGYGTRELFLCSHAVHVVHQSVTLKKK